MTQSAEFGATVNDGVRCVEPDIVVYAKRGSADPYVAVGPKIGLVVARTVGSAVERHRVARRLRHVARAVVEELAPGDRVVIRALPSSRHVISARLEQELRAGLARAKMLSRSGA
jgi:ribonuclease P protein component